MKRRTSNFTYLLIIVFVFSQANFCFAAPAAKDADADAALKAQGDAISDDIGNTGTAENGAESQAAPAANTVKKETKAKAKKQETNAVGDEQIKDLNKRIDEIQDNIKRLEEKTIEIANIADDVSKLKDDLNNLSTGYAENKKKTDKYLDDFTNMQDDLKEKMDKVQGWDDILGVLKKSINNNDIEIARLKKEINSLKNDQGEDNVLVQAAKSPYAIIAVGGIALIGLIVACVAVASK
jgi:chromosome segregation ATPase